MKNDSPVTSFHPLSLHFPSSRNFRMKRSRFGKIIMGRSSSVPRHSDLIKLLYVSKPDRISEADWSQAWDSEPIAVQLPPGGSVSVGRRLMITQTLEGPFSAMPEQIFGKKKAHVAAFFEIYMIDTLLHRSRLSNCSLSYHFVVAVFSDFAKFRRNVLYQTLSNSKPVFSPWNVS